MDWFVGGVLASFKGLIGESCEWTFLVAVVDSITNPAHHDLSSFMCVVRDKTYLMCSSSAICFCLSHVSTVSVYMGVCVVVVGPNVDFTMWTFTTNNVSCVHLLNMGWHLTGGLANGACSYVVVRTRACVCVRVCECCSERCVGACSVLVLCVCFGCVCVVLCVVYFFAT